MTDHAPSPALPTGSQRIAQKVHDLSDRAIALILIGPTVLLLLAVTVFPQILTIRLSLTNYRTAEFVGLLKYTRILNDPDIWQSMQATAHFQIWTSALQVLIGFALTYLISKKFRGNNLWTTIIVLPMTLSPTLVGNLRAFLYQPQIGLFYYVVAFFSGVDPGFYLRGHRM